MKTFSIVAVCVWSALVVLPDTSFAQQSLAVQGAAGAALAAQGQGNVPAAVQDAESAVERAVERFGIGISGGVGLDPELVIFGGHATFAPIFNRNVEFRPGVEFGLGEITTLFGVNLEVLYRLPGFDNNTR